MDSMHKTRTESSYSKCSSTGFALAHGVIGSRSSPPRVMRLLFELVPCCGSPRKEGERIGEAEGPPEGEEGERRMWTGRRRKRRRGPAAVAAQWKPSLCAISEDVVVVTVERVRGGGGGRGRAGERRKAAAADPAPEAERSDTSRKRSGGTYARVHDRVFNGDEYDHRRAPSRRSFQLSLRLHLWSEVFLVYRVNH